MPLQLEPPLKPDSSDPMVIMGRVASAFGIRGWVKIQPFSEYIDSLLDYETWWLGQENGPWREVKVAKTEVHSKTLVAQLPGCPDRNAAEKLKGLLIAIPRSQLPEEDEDEYYWNDLIGLAVVNEAGVSLGKVINLLETGANDVLVVQGATAEILIPFVETAVKQVDKQAGIIHVDWLADY